jgi:hypothetical protein
MTINPEIRLPSNLTYLRPSQNLIILNKTTLSLSLKKGLSNQVLTTNMYVAFDVLTTMTLLLYGMWRRIVL